MTTYNQIHCLCFDLSKYRSPFQFTVLALSVFFFHCFQGYMHELIFRLPGFKPFSMYFTLLQFAIYASLAILDGFRKEGFECFNTRRSLKDILTEFGMSFYQLVLISYLLKFVKIQFGSIRFDLNREG